MRRTQRLTEQSAFIFHGTVRKLGAATMAAVPAADNNAIVAVKEVLEAPELFRGSLGNEITIALKTTKGLKEGDDMVFFADGWLYGPNLAVRENGRLSAREDLAGLRAEVADARQKKADQQLLDRINSAELVVVGKVSATNSPAEPKPGGETEHDPGWRTATIQVESVEKGRLRTNSVTVLFPTSRDVMWFKAPKFSQGQEGVWFLRKEKSEGRPLDYFTALNPLDFQPRSQLGRIMTLIKGAR